MFTIKSGNVYCYYNLKKVGYSNGNKIRYHCTRKALRDHQVCQLRVLTMVFNRRVCRQNTDENTANFIKANVLLAIYIAVFTSPAVLVSIIYYMVPIPSTERKQKERSKRREKLFTNNCIIHYIIFPTEID